MLKFFWGTVGSGKSLNLLSSYLNQKRNPKSVAKLVKPQYDTRNLGVYTRFGDVEVNADIMYNGNIEAFNESIEEATHLFIDEIQFFNTDFIKNLYSLAKKNKNIFCFGLRNDYKLNLWPSTLVLLTLADEIIYLESECQICFKDKAVFNKKTDETKGDVGFHYIGVCSKCYG